MRPAPMRRQEKEIKDPDELEDILKRGQLCRIAMVDDGIPYLVPMNYGYKNGCLYLHSAKEGRKVEILRRNNLVCFQIDVDYELEPKKDTCDWPMRYKSVIGWGRVHFIQENEEKLEALNNLLGHYTDARYEVPKGQLGKTAILRIEIDHMTGKRSED
jgi:nitroimidazol reductase NimA-like FMN-containing flavoprotein (pyridoxamine 5'-phosphate oxidase superfamily)